jgi:hypothetical protein
VTHLSCSVTFVSFCEPDDAEPTPAPAIATAATAATSAASNQTFFMHCPFPDELGPI